MQNHRTEKGVKSDFLFHRIQSSIRPFRLISSYLISSHPIRSVQTVGRLLRMFAILTSLFPAFSRAIIQLHSSQQSPATSANTSPCLIFLRVAMASWDCSTGTSMDEKRKEAKEKTM